MSYAIVYIRQRSDDELTCKQGIERQRRVCRRLAKTQNLALAGEYVDIGVGANDNNRPALRDALQACEQPHVSALLVAELDRLTRRREDYKAMATALTDTKTLLFVASQEHEQ